MEANINQNRAGAQQGQIFTPIPTFRDGSWAYDGDSYFEIVADRTQSKLMYLLC